MQDKLHEYWHLVVLASLGTLVAFREYLYLRLILQDDQRNERLFSATKEDDEKKVRILLKAKADVNAKDEYGKNPLDYAKAEEMKAALREHGGKHSLFYAVEERPELVAELIKEGADAARTDKDGCTALWLACKEEHEAAAAELMEATKLAGALDLQPHLCRGLPRQGGWNKHSAFHSKCSALHQASENGLAGTVAKLLSHGANAGLANRWGCTALWLACNNKHEAAAAELMEATKLANALDLQAYSQDDNGRSALHKASENGLAGTVAKLLSLGSNAGLADKNGETPIDIALNADNDEVKTAFAEHAIITDDNKNELLLAFVRFGLVPRLREVLQAGANAAHANKDGCTALWLACDNKQEAAAAELMEATKLAGALDLQARAWAAELAQLKGGYYKCSALHVATKNGLVGTVAKLLSHGANTGLADYYGKTPLDYAKNDEVKTAFVEHTIITDDNKNELLLACARIGLVPRLRALLQAGANAAHANENGETALWLACAYKQEAAAAELMEATKLAGALDLQDDGDSRLNGGWGNKHSALHRASENGLVGTVAKLLSHGANAGLEDKRGETPLEYADNDEVKTAFAEHITITDDNKNELLLACARIGLVPLLRALLQAGANAAHAKKDGCTALWLACDNKQEAAAAELMEATKLAGALDLQDDDYKRSALHVASENGLAGTVAKLLSHGANAALADKRGCTALWLACANKHEGAAAELMEATKLAGALDLQDKSETRSALHKASEEGLAGTVAQLVSLGADAALKDKYGCTALLLVCANKHEGAAAELMEATKLAGALDLQVNSHSALHIASAEGLAGTVAQLVSLGADATLKNENGCTALWLACAKQHEGAAAELMEATKLAGALDLQDNGGENSSNNKRSALHKASEGGLAGTVAQLLSLGADAALKDEDGKMPLELASTDDVKAAFAAVSEEEEMAGIG